MTRKSCAVGMRNAILRNCLKWHFFYLQFIDKLLLIYCFPGLLEAPSLPPQLAVETVSYKIFLTGKPAVGKTSTVAKLLGQGTVYSVILRLLNLSDYMHYHFLTSSFDLVVISKML